MGLDVMIAFREKINAAVEAENIILPLDPSKIADEYLTRNYNTEWWFF